MPKSASKQQNEDPTLAEAIGASDETSIQVLTLYIPNKDCHNAEFGHQRKWVLEAAGLLARIGGGVTIMPPAVRRVYAKTHHQFRQDASQNQTDREDLGTNRPQILGKTFGGRSGFHQSRKTGQPSFPVCLAAIPS